jgi:drug/metabolite transporter (DMT)-like permease
MLKGIVISGLEIFALIFAFYGVVALGGQDNALGIVLLVAALISGVLGFVLTVTARRPEPEPPFDFQSLGRRSFQIDVDELRA